jgi:hypothetical protein
LAISECTGIIMETFDTSDLSPGMIGRPSGQDHDQKRTNYSAFPRVTAGFAVIHSFAFILSAASTALGGHLTRRLGQRWATGVFAAILFLLTVLLLLSLVRFKKVIIIPQSQVVEMDRLVTARRKSITRLALHQEDPDISLEDDEAWKPTMMGNPVSKMRRMNVLELGRMTRWQEIRQRNKLIDEGEHINCAALDQGLEALDDHVSDLRRDAQYLLRMASQRAKGSKRSRRSDQRGSGSGNGVELDNLCNKENDMGGASPFVERDCFLGQIVKEEDETDVAESHLRQRLV